MSDLPIEQIKNTLSETQEFDYRPEDWQVVFKQLHPPRKRRFLFFFWLTLAGLAVAALVPFILLDKGVQETGKTAEVMNIPEAHKKATRAKEIEAAEVSDAPASPEVNFQKQRSQTINTLRINAQKTGNPEFMPVDKAEPLFTKANASEHIATIENLTIPVADQGRQPFIQEVFPAPFKTIILPTLFFEVTRKKSMELPEGIVMFKPVNTPGTVEIIKPDHARGRMALGINHAPGETIALDGDQRTPKAAGQSFEFLFGLNEKTFAGFELRKQRSFSYHDSLEVAVANQWYPDWSDNFETYYDTLDIAQQSLSLDVVAYRTLLSVRRIKLHAGLGVRFNLGREQQVRTVIGNPYFGSMRAVHEISFSEKFKGLVPKLMVDVPLYKGFGLSFGLEYLIPAGKTELDIQSAFSGVGKLYFAF